MAEVRATRVTWNSGAVYCKSQERCEDKFVRHTSFKGKKHAYPICLFSGGCNQQSHKRVEIPAENARALAWLWRWQQ